MHRLDRDTSGLLMFAKDEKTQNTLRDNWHNIVTDRRYVAVVAGEMENNAGMVRSWLTDRKLYVYSSPTDDGGKEAITHYRTIKRANGFSLVELMLETGRKNQIRVHMQDLGHVYSDDIGTVFIYFRKTSSLEESRIYFSNLFLSSDYFSKYICLRTKI